MIWQAERYEVVKTAHPVVPDEYSIVVRASYEMWFSPVPLDLSCRSCTYRIPESVP